MDIDIILSDKQYKAFETLNKPDIKCVLYGGSKGGGKSVFGCYWIYLKAVELIKKFNLQYQQYPIGVAFIGRKRGVDFNDTTLETWKRFIPSSSYRLRSQEKEIIIHDRVKIAFGGFDDEQNVKKFNSAEFAYYFIDQAEEISRDDIGLLRGTLRLKIKSEVLDYKGLLTANPADCWLKDDFITKLTEGNAFIRALPSDNPYLPSGYIDTLKDAFKHRPELLRAYLYGDWDVLADSDIVIKPGWVNTAVERKLNNYLHKRLVTCDPARFGDDETVIYVLQAGEIIAEKIYGQKSTMETAGNCIVMKNEYNADLIIVDETGVGGGVVDRLNELEQPVYGVNFGSKATDDIKRTKYYNLRAEVFWEAAQLFADNKVSIPDDTVLRNQLGHIKYKTASRGRIQIESKAEIKERLDGASPDRADALLMGLWGLQFVPEEKYDFKRTDNNLLDKINTEIIYKGSNPIYDEMIRHLSKDKIQKSDYEL